MGEWQTNRNALDSRHESDGGVVCRSGELDGRVIKRTNGYL